MARQSAFSRQVEASEAVHDAVMAVLGHVCKTCAATPEALKNALDKFSVEDVSRSLERRIKQPCDPFAGIA